MPYQAKKRYAGKPKRKQAAVRGKPRGKQLGGVRRYVRRGVRIARKVGSYAGTAGRALALAEKVAALMNIEHKFFDTNGFPQSTVNGAIYRLDQVPQGVTGETRVGDSIKVQSLNIHYFIRDQISGVMAGDYRVRVILFRDKEEYVGTTVSKILDAGLLGTGYACLIPKDHDSRFNSKILYDKVHWLKQTEKTSTNVHRVRIKLGTHIQYSSGALTVVDGGIKLLLICDNGVDAPHMQYLARLRYTDD